MILVIGGLGAGKRRFVTEALGYAGEQMAGAELNGSPVVYDVQELARSLPVQQLLPALLEKQVVICNEVGCGIVPAALEELRWREEVGRLCCLLAAQADAVVRVCCGIPQWIKGRL